MRALRAQITFGVTFLPLLHPGTKRTREERGTSRAAGQRGLGPLGTHPGGAGRPGPAAPAQNEGSRRPGRESGRRGGPGLGDTAALPPALRAGPRGCAPGRDVTPRLGLRGANLARGQGARPQLRDARATRSRGGRDAVPRPGPRRGRGGGHSLTTGRTRG